MDRTPKYCAAEDIGLGLFDSIKSQHINGQQSTIDLYSDLLGDGDSISLEMVKYEWLYLRVFSVDFSLYLALGDTPVKAAVFRPFWQEIRAWLQVEFVAQLPKRSYFYKGDVATIPAEEEENAYQRLSRRMPLYANAIQNPDKLGDNYSVAKIFSALCGGGGMNAVFLRGIEAYFHKACLEQSESIKPLRIVG